MMRIDNGNRHLGVFVSVFFSCLAGRDRYKAAELQCDDSKNRTLGPLLALVLKVARDDTRFPHVRCLTATRG